MAVDGQLGLGFRAGAERTRGEREKHRGGSTYRSRGRGAGSAQLGHGGMARQWLHWHHSEEEERADRGGPHFRFLNIWLFLFQLKTRSIFWDLIKALKQFYKFGENSQRLPITFSTSTKIGVAKLKVLSNIYS